MTTFSLKLTEKLATVNGLKVRDEPQETAEAKRLR